MEGFDNIGVRWRVIESKNIKFAPFLMSSIHRSQASHNTRIANRLGIAIEKTAGRWTLDASLSLIGLKHYPTVDTASSKMSFLDTVLGSELGISRQFSDSNWFRFGLMGPLPTLSIIHKINKKGFIKGSLGTLGDQHFFQAEFYRIAL